MLDYKKFNDHLDEEYQGVLEYVDLYKQTNEGIFRDMAKEEMTHAKHLEWYLNKNCQLTDHMKTKDAAVTALNEIWKPINYRKHFMTVLECISWFFWGFQNAGKYTHFY